MAHPEQPPLRLPVPQRIGAGAVDFVASPDGLAGSSTRAESSGSRTPFVEGQRVQLPRGEVNYQLRGLPSGPLVICIHGLNGALSSFATVEPFLVNAGFRVLCFDLFGFGLSASPWGRLDHRVYVEQVEELLIALKVPPTEQVLLFGFSMGGVIAVEFALRFPQRVARLLLVAPGGLMDRSETPCATLLFKGLRGRCGCFIQNYATAMTWLCGCLLRRQLNGTFQLDVREPEKFKDVAQRNSDRFLWNVRRSVNSYLKALRYMPLWKEDFMSSYMDLAKGQVPVLFIWGDSDNTVPWEEAAGEVIRLFGPGDTSCILVPGAGHGLLLEDATEVGNSAVAWFAKVPDPNWHQHLAYFRLPTPGGAEETPSPFHEWRNTA